MTTNILVVDDEQSSAETLRAVLEAAGYQVTVAATPQEALAQVERALFEVVLLDLHLRAGEIDGLIALNRLKELSPSTKVCILTGDTSLQMIVQAMHAGATEILIRPLDVTQLKVSIVTSERWRDQVADLTLVNIELRRLSQERDVLRQEAQARTAQLEELDRVKEEFIATASHDLKSPLTTIRGFSQLLLRRVQSPGPDLAQLAEGLATIDAQATRMAALLEDLLDASRIQTGVLDLRTAPCELGACLATVLARLSPHQRDRVDLTLGDAPLAGDWERQRIEQVLANLVENALKYSDESGRVRVMAERHAAQAEIEVAVSDQGMGIPAAELPRLFERFYRTPQAFASGLLGTGLGLYICRGIVTAHGGRIWAESPGVGQGATFRFTLPEVPPQRVGPTIPPFRDPGGHDG